MAPKTSVVYQCLINPNRLTFLLKEAWNLRSFGVPDRGVVYRTWKPWSYAILVFSSKAASAASFYQSYAAFSAWICLVSLQYTLLYTWDCGFWTPGLPKDCRLSTQEIRNLALLLWKFTEAMFLIFNSLAYYDENLFCQLSLLLCIDIKDCKKSKRVENWAFDTSVTC